MAYVPGFRHDLFLSHSSIDDATWVAAFESGLRQALRERLGQSSVDVWKDVEQLRLGDNWPAAIEDAIGGTAAFVAIVSPGYLNSDWCQRERIFFLERPLGSTDIGGDRTRRFLKIVKTPADDDRHLKLLPNAQHVLFFKDGNARTGAIEFALGDNDFRSKLGESAYAIADLLRKMRRSREPVFVATPPPEVRTEWQHVKDELQAQGFDVRPEGPLDASFADEVVRSEVERSILAVLLFGDSYDSFVERQLRLVQEMGKRVVCWVRKGATPGDERQLRLLESIRRGDGFLQPGTLLDRHSSRDLIREVLEALKPKPAALASQPSGAPHVYLLYDPTTERDSQLATTVRASIELEQLQVFTPETSAATDRLERHRQLLRDCDGVLLCRSQAASPDQWLLQTVPDVLFAEQQLSRPPILSKALLLANSGGFQGFPNVNVIPLTDTISPADLGPFLEPLRRARHA